MVAMAAKYGQTIRWTRFDGTVTTFGVTDCDSFEEARRKAVEWAESAGWTPPKWWQFWRWHDTKPAKPSTDDQ